MHNGPGLEQRGTKRDERILQIQHFGTIQLINWWLKITVRLGLTFRLVACVVGGSESLTRSAHRQNIVNCIQGVIHDTLTLNEIRQ